MDITKDFLLEVRKGNVAGHRIVHKYGRNAAVPSGTWEQISTLSVATSFLSAPTTVRVKAGNAADTAAGAGAQSITIEGIDANLNEVKVAIPTAGASASASTSVSFWRVYRAYVSSGACGTYGGNNTGDVVIENTAGTTDLIKILAGFGQSQYGAYAIPLGETAFLLGGLITVDGLKAADVKLCIRANLNDATTPFEPVLVKKYFDGVLGALQFNPQSPLGSYSELTDIWFDANGGGASTEVSVDFELLLIEGSNLNNATR